MKYLKHFRILGSCLISPSDFLMKKELYDLLGSYEDVLNNGIGMSNSGSQKFTIEVDPSVLPIRSYAFRMPEDKRRVLRQQVEEHILEGRVRPSRSAWASRAFSLSKKYAATIDEWRMVIDYGPLNEVSKKFPFPAPDTDRIIANMSGALYFSCMDINKAFHQIPCANEDTIEKTAFVIPDGLFEWLVMPMGVSNGPAVQQALMHRVF